MRMSWANLTAPVLIAVLGLILLGCGGAAVDPTPIAIGAPGAAPQQSAATVEEPAKAPVVVLPTQEGRPSREELAALILSATEAKDQPAETAADSTAEQGEATTAPASAQGTESKPPVLGPAGAGATPGDAPAGAQVETPAPEVAESPTATAVAPKATAEPARRVGGRVGDQAAEIAGIVAWINSEPLTIKELAGKVVLVDFWTYTCINCIRTFPFLKLWHSRYEDDGLVILGVHAPEFDFERDLDNVVQATQDNSIAWPVALDNNYVTWRNYSNRFWPAKYLIDKDGIVRYTHFGEGQYAETERKIRELLEETGVDLSGDGLGMPQDQVIDPGYRSTRNAEITRELYAGYTRGRSDVLYGRGGYVVQPEYYTSPDRVAEFKAPDKLIPHVIYFNGSWLPGPERARHAKESKNYEEYLTIVYSARSVNAVLTSETGKPYKVRITVDGEFLTEENKGADVTIGPGGESFVLVDKPRLFNIVENPSYVRRARLQMSSNSADFGLFAFTFGVYQKSS
ncbi:MAG: redoxin domain-containing protein [Chloroflexi bacterium]|nr:redoxin domain-containing protein [Chloroflexota bacterium]